MKELIIKVSVKINAKPEKVWEALVQPALIKKYLFGTDTEAEWKPGGSIFFRGIWEGKAYEDRGKILEIVPQKILTYTYWSSFSGTPDLPENYKTIHFELIPQTFGTLLILSQDNNIDEASKSHSEQNWKVALDGLKKVAEEI